MMSGPNSGEGKDVQELPEKRLRVEIPSWDAPNLGMLPRHPLAAAGDGGVTPRQNLWDSAGLMTPRQADTSAMTPRRFEHAGAMTPSRWDRGPDGMVPTPSMSAQNFSTTPASGTAALAGVGGGTVTIGSSMFGGFATPLMTGGMATPAMGAGIGAGMATPDIAFTSGGVGGETPMQSRFAETSITSSLMIQKATEKAEKLKRDWERANVYLTDEELDELLPSAGFTVAQPPADYVPKVNHEAPNFFDVATTLLQAELEQQQREQQGGAAAGKKFDIPDSLGENMPQMKAQDAPVFEELIEFAGVPEESLPEEVRHSVTIMRDLFRIKNGDPDQRRLGMSHLTNAERSRRMYGARLIFDKVLIVWRSRTLDGEQQHRFVKLVKSLVLLFGGEGIKPLAREIIQAVQPLLFDSNKYTREDGRDVVSNLARLCGIGCILQAVSGDIEAEDKVVRNTTARTIAVAARAVEPEKVMSFIERLASDERLTSNARHTAIRVIHEIADCFGSTILRHLHHLTYIAAGLLKSKRVDVRTETAHAIAAMAESCAPFGIDSFESNDIVRMIQLKVNESHGRNLAALLKALGALIPLMDSAKAEATTTKLLDSLTKQFKDYHESELRRVVLGVVETCVSCQGVTTRYLQESLLHPFFEGFWGERRAALERQDLAALSAATVAIAKKLGGADVVPRLLPHLREAGDEGFHRMVSETVRRIITHCGTLDFSDQQMESLRDACQYALKVDEEGHNNAALHCFAAVVNGFGGARIRTVAPIVCSEVLERFTHRVAQIRRQAAELTALIAQTLVDCDNVRIVQEFWSPFYNSLDAETEPGPIASTLKALRALAVAMGGESSRIQLTKMENPSVGELHQRVAEFVRSNREREVRLQCIELIGEIVRRVPMEYLQAAELEKLATHHLFPLLAEDHRATRKATAEVYGDIAKKLMPYNVVKRLVENLSKDGRTERICTAVALSVIARKTGALTVIPFILNEFEVCEGTQSAAITQHAILKCIRFMFEYLGTAGKEYTYSVLPLLQRAMTDPAMQHRRQAIEAAKAVVLAVVGTDGNFEDVVVHLLNYAHPNIVEMLSGNTSREKEERNKLVTAVVQLFEAAALVVGAPVVFQYLVQGLYHPAQKVRDIYWRTYNMIYIQNPEALIPCHPRLAGWNLMEEVVMVREALAHVNDPQLVEMEVAKLPSLLPKGVPPELMLIL